MQTNEAMRAQRNQTGHMWKLKCEVNFPESSTLHSYKRKSSSFISDRTGKNYHGNVSKPLNAT